jgi:hypothetical protein
VRESPTHAVGIVGVGEDSWQGMLARFVRECLIPGAPLTHPSPAVPPQPTPAATERRPSLAAFVLRIGLYVVLGAPLVGYLWQTVNEVLALHFDPIRLLVAIPVAALLAGLLVLLNRSITRWLGETG